MPAVPYESGLQGVSSLSEDHGHQSGKACQTIKYSIYDKDQWPYKQGEAGGYAHPCQAELMADYSILTKSKLGPYDVHEILHIYQAELGALPQQHVFFGPAMLEAMREIGDSEGYQRRLASTKQEVTHLEEEFSSGKFKPERKCQLAETEFEERLYIENPRYVYLFYRKLVPGRERDLAQREARFNRMYNQITDGKARPFLTSHGCAAF